MKGKRRSMANDCTDSDPSLRRDVIGNILSRLPVKSVKRFESVSKSWYYLLKSPQFISAHLRRSSRRPFLLNHRYHNPSGSNVLCLIHSRFKFPLEIRVPFLCNLIRYPKIVASCNGLLCLDVSPCYCSDFVLWNISTCQFRLLPSPRINATDKPIWMVACGFGYNCQITDFKLVRIVSFYCEEDDLPCVRAEVYSWATGSWRIMDGRVTEETIGSCVIPEGQKVVTVNGSLNWLANGVGKLATKKFIVSFDTGTEEFRRIQIPDFNSSGNCAKILEFQESLAVALYPALPVYPGYGSSMNRIELWVFDDEYFDDDGGGGKCDDDVNVKRWAKYHTMVLHFAEDIIPIGVHKDSELLLKRVEAHYLDLCFYNPINLSRIILPICSSEYNCEFFNYVDSLFPVSNAGFEEAE